MMFRACANGDESILITGGMNRYGDFEKETTRLDIVDDREIAWVTLPNLSKARFGHGCCSNGAKAFVFGGDMFADQTSSMEILSQKDRQDQADWNALQKWELVTLESIPNRSSVLMACSSPSEVLILGGGSDGKKC